MISGSIYSYKYCTCTIEKFLLKRYSRLIQQRLGWLFIWLWFCVFLSKNCFYVGNSYWINTIDKSNLIGETILPCSLLSTLCETKTLMLLLDLYVKFCIIMFELFCNTLWKCLLYQFLQIGNSDRGTEI